MLSGHIAGLLIALLGGFICFTYSGIVINIKNKTIRQYTSYFGFKKGENPFTFSDSIELFFNEFNIEFHLNHKLEFRKPYHQKLKEAERVKLIEKFVKPIIDRIKQQTQSTQ